MITTALVTNADIVEFGIRGMLAASDDISLAAVAGNIEDCLLAIPNTTPDVVIVDVQSIMTPRAIALKHIANVLKNISSKIALIGLTDWTNKSRYEFARSLGARGYCLKTIGRDRLHAAIRRAARGDTYVHDDYRRLIELNSNPLFDTIFGKRQLEALDLMVQGYTNKEIATTLQLSIETVKSHIKIILKRLGAKDRGHAISIVLNETINVLTQQNLYFNADRDSCAKPQAMRLFSDCRT